MSEDPKIVSLPEGIDFNQPILDLNNHPLKDKEGGRDLTLGEVCCSALLANIQGDPADATQKFKRFKLAQKIQGSVEEEKFPTLRLNSTQKKMIEELVSKTYAVIVYGRLYEALEGLAAGEE